MVKKPVVRDEMVEVIYDDERWGLLKVLRGKAIQLMGALEQANIHSIVHGSIARGDVTEKSDVDVFIPYTISSFMVELALERAGIKINRRIIVQATPSYAVKGHIEVDGQCVVSFPLVRLRPLERDFYKFGGEATLILLKRGIRVPGVDKRLMLIEPTRLGHIERTIIGREEEVARLLRISVETVLDRVRALTRRDEVGRTGVFLKRELSPDETFENVLKRLADENPAIRRRTRL